MHHAAQREEDIPTAAVGEAEFAEAGGGQDDRVRHLQAMALREPQRFQRNGVVEAQVCLPPW